jgi:isopenicillin N synthase-like dioxygenase
MHECWILLWYFCYLITRALYIESLTLFQVKNHGISPEIITSAYHTLQHFFGLPLEEKMKASKSRVLMSVALMLVQFQLKSLT